MSEPEKKSERFELRLAPSMLARIEAVEGLSKAEVVDAALVAWFSGSSPAQRAYDRATADPPARDLMAALKTSLASVPASSTVKRNVKPIPRHSTKGERT
jgi:hypothetical protein